MHFYYFINTSTNVSLLTLVFFFFTVQTLLITVNKYCSHNFLNILLDTFATVKQTIINNNSNNIIYFLLNNIFASKLTNRMGHKYTHTLIIKAILPVGL